MESFGNKPFLERINTEKPEKHLIISLIASVLECKHRVVDELFAEVDGIGHEKKMSYLVVLETALRIGAFYDSLVPTAAASIIRNATASDRTAVEFAENLASVQLYETPDGLRMNIADIKARWWPARPTFLHS